MKNKSGIMPDIIKKSLFSIHHGFKSFYGVFVKFLLFFVYIFGLGISYILIGVFQRRLLWKKSKKESYWIESDKHIPSLEESARQS